MAAIYDKALKRRDYSGIIDKNKIQKEQEERAAESGGSKSRFRPSYSVLIAEVYLYRQRRAKLRRRRTRRGLRKRTTLRLGLTQERL
jgi:hypothetical protein